MKQVSTGGLSFQEIRRRGKFYVDKTLLIKDMLDADDGGVFLYTRPRRFGKTTNVTMLNAFFNIDYKGNDWFDWTDEASNRNNYTQVLCYKPFRGQCSVILMK